MPARKTSTKPTRIWKFGAKIETMLEIVAL
jgi:hypothetical protein